MIETVNIIKPYGSDLASRQLAGHLRCEVLSRLAAGESVTIDLRKVICISSSYADELFGVLVAEIGLDAFRRSVSLKGASPDVLKGIVAAMKERGARPPSDDEGEILSLTV